MKNIIEVGHIYLEDIGNFKNLLTESIKRYKEYQTSTNNNHFVLLVDDQREKKTLKEKQELLIVLKNFYVTNGIENIDIYFENDFQNYAQDIISMLDANKLKKVYFKKSKKSVIFYNYDGHNIPLFEENINGVKNYCQLLSLAWSVFKIKKYKGENLLILPAIYKKIEERVNVIQYDIIGAKNKCFYH